VDTERGASFILCITKQLPVVTFLPVTPKSPCTGFLVESVFCSYSIN